MQNIRRFLAVILWFIIGHTAFSQTHSFVSITAWPMPEGHRYGLYAPAFKIVPRFQIEPFGSRYELSLKLEVTLASASNPVAPYTGRYMHDGTVYTDAEIGLDAFRAIRLKEATFNIVVQGPGINLTTKYETFLGRKTIGNVDKNAKSESYVVIVRGLDDVSYHGSEMIDKAVSARNAAIRKIKDDEKRVADAKIAAEKKKAADAEALAEKKKKDDEESAAKIAKEKLQKAEEAKQAVNNNNKLNDGFWSDKSPAKTSNTTTASNVVPDQAIHRNLPDFVRTTDGGYFQRGGDGKFRQVSAEEYQQAKKQVADSKVQAQSEPEQPKMTPEEFGAQASKNFRDQVAQNNAIYENIDRKFDMYKQNFYHAQAVQSGKENLAGLSRLEGNYSSVQELEAEFNQKYNSIRGEVNNLEQARNSKLNNAVNSTFNGNSTEQAIGQGMQLIGSMINNAKAAKERKEAQAALTLERDQQLAAMAAAKTRARIELRAKLIQSFPGGGTPLSSHKITLPEVYVFAYVNDRATINNEQALVSVSNVFPVQQYSDGSYPYKTTVLNKLKGYAAGEITLVGYYGDRTRAEEMRETFINLAAKSELVVKPFTFKTLPGETAPRSNGGTGDFWETGKKPATKPSETQEPERKKESFWNN